MVVSGETGRFSFTVKAPTTPGTYREYFQLVIDGVQWLDDVGLYWDITVQ
ncbi:MAG: Curculin domain protein (Mannose-binding) lectin [Microgenomates group bacterium GW2011_GWA2_46_7]|nr:MAG: Curculin domain protein (Mannose-binding) lectin [Microgenomates group bacterium GW2011_GWA2_46_7]